MTYTVRLTATALRLIQNIPDKKTQKTILKRAEGLAEDPESQGKALVKDLAGLRSVHTAGRYRVIYKVVQQTVMVCVVAFGIRKKGDKKDIYKITRKLLRAGLLDADEELF